MSNIDLYAADWCFDFQKAIAYLKKYNFNFINVGFAYQAITRVETITNGKCVAPIVIKEKKPYVSPEKFALKLLLNRGEEP